MYKKCLWVIGGVLASFAMGVPSASGEEATESIQEVGLSASVAKAKEALVQFARNDEDVIKQYEQFVSLVQAGVKSGSLSEAEAMQVLDATAFAAEKHQFQVRKTAKKTPYVIHPLGVAYYVMKIGNVYDHQVIIAALLHDTLEEEIATADEISGRYGKEVSAYVVELTDNKKLSLKERKRQQIIQAFHQSKGAAIVKFADKLHNLGMLMQDPPEGWSQDRKDQYFQWAQAVIDNLPQVNESLKSAVHKQIAKYWEAGK